MKLKKTQKNGLILKKIAKFRICWVNNQPKNYLAKINWQFENQQEKIVVLNLLFIIKKIMIKKKVNLLLDNMI